MERKVAVWFVKYPNTSIDGRTEKEMRIASEYAFRNLEQRYKVKMSGIFFEQKSMILTLEIPDNLNFDNPGRRLRGISAYLLKHYPDRYKPLLVGSRLLWYQFVEEGEKTCQNMDYCAKRSLLGKTAKECHELSSAIISWCCDVDNPDFLTNDIIKEMADVQMMIHLINLSFNSSELVEEAIQKTN